MGYLVNKTVIKVKIILQTPIKFSNKMFTLTNSRRYAGLSYALALLFFAAHARTLADAPDKQIHLGTIDTVRACYECKGFGETKHSLFSQPVWGDRAVECRVCKGRLTNCTVCKTRGERRKEATITAVETDDGNFKYFLFTRKTKGGKKSKTDKVKNIHVGEHVYTCPDTDHETAWLYLQLFGHHQIMSNRWFKADNAQDYVFWNSLITYVGSDKTKTSFSHDGSKRLKELKLESEYDPDEEGDVSWFTQAWNAINEYFSH